MHRWGLLFIVLVASILTTLWGWGHADRSDTFAVLADAWLHGHVFVDVPDAGSGIASAAIDAITYAGHRFVVEGPFPAVLMLPFVAIFGPSPALQCFVSRAIGVVCVGLLWMLARRVGLERGKCYWLCAFAYVSTDLWWCASEGSVFFFSPVVAVALTLGALVECFGKRRGWLIALLAAAAAFTRFPLIVPIAILYPFQVWRSRRSLVSYGAVIALAALGWVAYNEVRFGTLNDLGYGLFCQQDPGCYAGLAGPQYLGYELYSFFLRGPALVENAAHVAQWPYVTIDAQGLALTFSSPALVLCCYARPKPLLLLWLTAALVAVPSLTYYLDGWVQVGMRHALDFEPFLLLIMIFALRDMADRWWVRPILSLSIAVGFWQAWFAHTFRCC